jgi:hypothetical protein
LATHVFPRHSAGRGACRDLLLSNVLILELCARKERLRLIVKDGKVHKDAVAAARNRRAATAA